MGSVFIARQPIFDRALEVTAYELLFRGPNQHVAVIEDDDEATSTVVINAFTELGLDTVVGDRRAWINVSRDFMVSGMARALPSGLVTLELLENQPCDDQLIATLDEHRELGYRIALDDFTWDDARARLLDHVDIVKVDLLNRDIAAVADDARRLASYDVTLVAEKVETRDDHEHCMELGFDLFQGYFFCKPERLEARCVAPTRLAVLQLVAALQDPNIEFRTIERLVSRDVALSFRLLRYVNSAFFGLRREVSSIGHALTLLGIDNVKRWTTLSAFAGIDDKPRALIETALVRARFCELAGEGDRDQLFTLGLFSVVDALLDAPMERVLASIPFPEEMRAALISQSGPQGRLLETALSFERGDFTPPLDGYGKAYIEAMAWATHAAGELFVAAPATAA